jgi:hypothetical protein
MRYASRGIQTVIVSEFGEAGRTLTSIHREHAPHERGGLGRGLKARVGSRGGWVSVEVESTVRSKEGFPYTQATRTGRRGFAARNARALAFTVGGRLIFRKSVGPYKPPSDWVERARGPAEAALGRTSDEIGRQIVTRLL